MNNSRDLHPLTPLKQTHLRNMPDVYGTSVLPAHLQAALYEGIGYMWTLYIGIVMPLSIKTDLASASPVDY
jgi:hypothetical protein